ncbi:MAG: hypothetical protein ACI9J2_000442 [Saprospiraceae bacterium]|jgi:hypothetical protein
MNRYLFLVLFSLIALAVKAQNAENVTPIISYLLLDNSPTTPPPGCTDAGDNDSDRILNCYETNTNIFVNAQNTGTDPNNPDTDGDAIKDGDEVLGTVAGLNLPSMGVNPLRKNILLEYDWFDDNLDCPSHSHRPTAAAIASYTAAMANAPNVNPDGSTGITAINDYGQGGVFTGGNFIDDVNGVLVGGVNQSEFGLYKAANFDALRNGYFHYVILPHHYNTTSGSSGQAELPGDDLIVSLQCFSSTRNTSHTILHELGHNLGIRHGGDSNCNHKPNYNSVMNYKYQFPGVDTNCDSNPEAISVLDLSRNANIDLNENNLNENSGVCAVAPVAINWNGINGIESSISFNINSADDFESDNCGGLQTVLEDYNDWGNISFTGLSDFDGMNLTSMEIINCNNPAPQN